MGKCLLLKSGSSGIDPDELTAVAGDVLANKKAGVAGNDEPVTGTMPNRGAISQSLNCGGSYTIPSGYHNGSGKVTANSLSSQTSANASASQILTGQTAWVNGSRITGSMPNRGAISQGLGINGTYTIPAGYHNGNGKVTQNIPVQGGSTTTPGTANKTIVAANRYVNGNIIVAGSSNLTAGNIKKGINIFGVTGTWEGYVAAATDLYKYGINNANFKGSGVGRYSETIFESNQIKMYAAGEDTDEDGYTSHSAQINSQKAYNLTGYSRITFSYYIERPSGGRDDVYIRIGVGQSPYPTLENYVTLSGKSDYISTVGNKTASFDCSSLNSTKYITFYLSAGGDGNSCTLYINQITLS